MTVLLAPLLAPLAGAVFCILAGPRARLQRWTGLVSPVVVTAAAVALTGATRGGRVVTVEVGGWPAPFGIVLVADLAAAMLVLLAGIVSLCAAVHALASVDDRRSALGHHAIAQVLLAGVSGTFLAGDLFNLYVWFEVLLIASFVLMTLGGSRAEMEGAIKYVTLNLVASALFLTAAGLVFGKLGTLNLADLSLRLGDSVQPGLAQALVALLLVAFGIKAAAFPLFFWLPASYHTPPPGVSALFAGILTKVGVFAILRACTLLAFEAGSPVRPVLLWVAALTMIAGVLGAVAAGNVRRILAFHSVSQVGYMLLGIAVGGAIGFAGALIFMVHHGVVKSALFLIGGLIEREGGTAELAGLGGLLARRPGLAVLFLVAALSLAGVPPLGGFFAKLWLVQAGLGMGEGAAVAVALAVGLLTLVSMTKIWNEAFWKALPEGIAGGAPEAGRPSPALVAPAVLLGLLTIAMGVLAGPLLELGLEAGRNLLDRDVYIRGVLGGRR